MSPDKQKALFDKYPDIFREHSWPMSQTCMCWGMEFSEGWLGIMENLCARLALLKRYAGLEVVFVQNKEKFGQLRVYWRLDTFPIGATSEEQKHWYNIVDALVNEAERESERTCEETGEPGEMCVKEGWYKTLCEEKAKELGFVTAAEWARQREEAEKGAV